MKKVKKVFVSGVSGMTGSYMVDFLLEEYPDYEIYGGVRAVSVANTQNTATFANHERYHEVRFDLTDAHSIDRAIQQVMPDYFINLAAQSFVGDSWAIPEYTFQANATAVLHILEAIRKHVPECRFVTQGTSEEFGEVSYSPQDENHPSRPMSPYGAAKVASRAIVRVYRESYGLNACQTWMFNHSAPRRGDMFVTQKIVKNLVRINKEGGESMKLGNIYAKRDESHAKDIVKATWLCANQEGRPKDYVAASGKTHSVKDFCNLVLRSLDFVGEWRGEGLNEKFYTIGRHGEYEVPVIEISEEFYRPAEVELLIGNPERLKKDLQWSPEYDITTLVKDMVDSAIKGYEKENE